jgi:hypothetical protein
LAPGSRARRGAGRARLAAAALAAAAAVAACASSDAPFRVREGEEARFERAVQECELLTVDAEGREGPIGFDDCMQRRGFRRKGPIRMLLGR